MTPFAVVTDDATGQYPLADYALTPDMAIVDANGDGYAEIAVLSVVWITVTHATEAYVSVLASEFSDGQALQALKLLKSTCRASYLSSRTRLPVTRTQCPRLSPVSRSLTPSSACVTRWRTNGAPSSHIPARSWPTPC